MMKKILFPLIMLLIFPCMLFAAGKNEESGYEPVKGVENWNHEFDLTGLKDGQYNLIIEGRDKAGNIYYEGPINILVDPASDLPVTSISNPRTEERVGGNLYIVGTCVDDDGVASVEVKLDDGEFAPAEGKEFWAYSLDVGGISDGKHTISVRGTDINGLQGKETSTVFNLDTTKPLNRVTSHANGVLVSGRLRLTGSVVDANGVQELAYSTDGGTTYSPLNISYDQRENLYRFNLEVDTVRLLDGPYVYWFKSVDAMKSVGYAAFLFFVDNTEPALDIYTPLPNEGVNGVVTVAGKVTDKIGIKSFSYDAGEKDTGTIELKPGNPYWVHVFDFSAEKRNERQIIFSLEDTIGNISQYRYTIKLDHTTDLPTVTVAFPTPDSTVYNDVKFSGFTDDDDGVGSIMYSLDGSESVTMETGDAFDSILEGLKPGKHRLSVRAVDVNGLQGKETVIQFTSVDRVPAIGLGSLNAAGAQEKFRPGIEVYPLVKNVISGSVVSKNGVNNVESVFGEDKAQRISVRKGTEPDTYLFDIDVPANVPYGIVPIRISTKDAYEQESVFTSFIHVTNLGKIRAEPGIVFVDSRIAPDGTVRLSYQDPLSGVFVGESVRSVRFTTDPGVAVVSNQNERIIVRSVSPGTGAPTQIEVTTQKGHVFLSRELRFTTDSRSPGVTLSSPQAGIWVRDELNVQGIATDDTGIRSIEYSLNAGQSFQALPGTDASGTSVNFTSEIPISGVNDGIVPLDIRVTDTAGNITLTRTVIMKDTKEPLLTVIVPERDVVMNGRLLLFGRSIDEGRISAVELSYDDGETYIPVEGKESFFYEGTIPPEASGRISIRITDRAGNASTFRSEFTVGESSSVYGGPGGAADKEKPVIQVMSHAQNEKVNGRFAVAGKITDNAGIKSFTWSLNGGPAETVTLNPDNPYWMKIIDLNAMTTKRVSITLNAEDVSGNKNSLSFNLTPDEPSDTPTVTVKYPEPKSVVEGPVYAYGSILDDDGIRSVSYVLDNAEPVVRASSEGFLLDLSSMNPGPHVLKVSAIDVNGLQSKPVEIPFTLVGKAPETVMTNVASGKATTAFYPGNTLSGDVQTEIQGFIRSGNGIKNLEYQFSTDSGSPIGEKRKASMKKGSEASETVFSVPVPKELPYSQVNLILSIEDNFSKKVEYTTFFYNVRSGAGNVRDDEGTVFIDSRIDSGGVVRLDAGTELSGYYNGRPLRSASISPATNLLRLAIEGRFIVISSLLGGMTEPSTLNLVTVDGDEVKWGPKIFKTDSSVPVVTLTSPQTGSWQGAELTISGTVKEQETAVSGISYSLNGGDFRELAYDREKLALDGTFESMISLAGVADGNVHLVVRTDDTAGNTSYRPVSFKKDAEGPSLQLIAPPAEDRINGLTTLVGRAVDTGRITGAEFSLDGENFIPITGTDVYFTDVDFSTFAQIPEKLSFRSTDKSGNSSTFIPPLGLDLELDRPVVQIQTPEDGEVIRNDFIISGMVFDDDGVAKIQYRLDDGEFIGLPGGSSFSIEKSLSELTDNEHTIEVKAVDFGGVESETVKTTFKVSLEEPQSQMTSPRLDETRKGMLTLSGTASDSNGIRDIFVSFDNGNTFFRAEGQEEWKYTFNTRLLRDGVYSVIIKAVDAYGTEGLQATLISIDNTTPSLILDSPADGLNASEDLYLEGRVTDNLELSSLTMKMFSLEKPVALPEATELRNEILSLELPLDEVFSKSIDISSLEVGWYNVRLEAVDHADNHAWIARNVFIEAKGLAESLEILYPGEGVKCTGYFTLQGKVETEKPVGFVMLSTDGGTPESVPVDENGNFSSEMSPEKLATGRHTFRFKITKDDNSVLESNVRNIEYERIGNWIKIDSHKAGTFISARPFLTGTAGYYLPEPDKSDRAAWDRYQRQLWDHRVVRVEVSTDNGKTFLPANGLEKWQFRLETQTYSTGHLLILVKSIGADGSTAFASTHFYVDVTPPQIILFNLQENGRFNQKLPVTGTARDDNGVALVSAKLRLGDKANYEVPEFIQGLYFEGHVLGLTLWDAGFGLTFFDDNVKLQAQVGEAPQTEPSGRPSKFRGTVAGAKLLANILRLPASFFLGPDWDWLSSSFAVGANFSLVANSAEPFSFTGKSVVLTAVVVQLELPIVNLKNLRMFNTMSFYTEFQLWFNPAVVVNEDETTNKVKEDLFHPRMSFGVRMNVF